MCLEFVFFHHIFMRLGHALREAADNWSEHRATRMSAAVAFYSILSISSLSVAAISIAGLIYGEKAAAGELTSQLHNLLGDSAGEVAKLTLENTQQHSKGIAATILGACLLLIGASGVFTEIQDDLNSIWNVKPKPGRAIWMIVQDRLLSIVMVLVTGLLLLASLILATLLEAFSGYLGDSMQSLLTRVSGAVASFLIVLLLFASIFKYLPDARIAWRDVWLGAFITACLFTFGKHAIGLFMATFGSTTSFGAAGSLVAFLLWIYYSSMIFFFGAELTRVTVRHAGRSVVPSNNALLAEEKTPAIM
jgi:membrane protein